jgi:hypothetical protein
MGAAKPANLGGDMYRKLISMATLAVVAALSIGVSRPSDATASPTATAEVYWRCESGFVFETSGSAVHCKKPSWTETKPFMACVLATPTLKIDLVGMTDMCAGSVGVTVSAEPSCYPTDIAAGFTKRKVSGKDFCGKNHPVEIVAPSQQVTF